MFFCGRFGRGGGLSLRYASVARPITKTSARNLVAIVPERKKSGIAVNLLTARFRATIMRVYDAAGNVIETHEHASGFKEP